MLPSKPLLPRAPRRAPRLILLLAGLALTGASLGGCSSGDDDTAAATTTTTAPVDRAVAERVITTVATGEATGVPDNITASVSVGSLGPSAADVLAQTSTKTQALLDALALSGVDAKDVATTEISLGPTYDKKGKITGYSSNNSLRITFRDLETAGAKLDLLVKTVGDSGRIGWIQLGFNDPDDLLATARADAVTRARAQAEQMAKAGGTSLGKVQTITEVVPEFGGDLDAASRSSFDAAATSVPISAGSQELTVKVEVVFELA